MDNLIQVLFNTNHEAPNIYVIVVVVAMAFLIPPAAQYAYQKRQEKREKRQSREAKSGKSKKKNC